MENWGSYLEKLTELSTYMIWSLFREADQLLQLLQLSQQDLVYLKVISVVPANILTHFSQHPYNPNFLEIRTNLLTAHFIEKAENALAFSGLSIEDFVADQILAERLLNPLDPFRLGVDYQEEQTSPAPVYLDEELPRLDLI
jgi:hypothetical protein